MNYILRNYFVLIIILNKCFAKITINIKIASTKGGASVTFNGTDSKLVNHNDVTFYNITDANLKKGIRIELGKAPDEVFLSDPTDYGYIYQKYKWKQVHRIIQVKNAEVKEIINENIVLKTHNYIYNSTIPRKQKIKLIETVSTRINSFWSKDGYQYGDFGYKINLDYYKTAFNLTNEWRKEIFKTMTSDFGMKKFGYINVNPGKTITAKILAKKTTLVVQIVYGATLKGLVVANYARLYGKYHFWAPSITNIMKACNLNNEVLTTENILIKTYTDPVIVFQDATTRKKIDIMYDGNPIFKRKKKY